MKTSRSLAFAGCALLGLIGAAPAQAAPGPVFKGLSPGEMVVHQQTVPVRIALIGFGDEVTDAQILGFLPPSYRPAVRYPKFYGLEGRDLGLQYNFEYTVDRKAPAFAKRFFTYLRTIGKPGPLTVFQGEYNDQANNVLDVMGPVLYIDAPMTERWLSQNDLRVGPERGYTIYFINWFAKPDFQFHVFTKTDEPDPDTRYNFGRQRDSRKMVAWGGTSSRSWFYDFSAGPELWAGNFDVDDEDLDGDGDPDYRIPPRWEYGPTAYRPLSELGDDISVLTRLVAIDLLFTTSPLYDPLVSAPEPRGRKVAHVAMLEDEADASGVDWFHRVFAMNAWRSFQPYYSWKVGLSDTSPIDAGAKQALDIFAGIDDTEDCWTAYGTPGAQLFCYFDTNFASYVPPYNPRDAVGGIFSFNTSTDLGGLLGFADDNWVNGLPTHEFIFGNADLRASGYGFTSTIVHEFGHHLGMSHPHDGYDPEIDVDFGASGSTYFAWLGDESDTVMHYISVSNGFGRHNQDNMYRWETAGYLNWSNALAGDILGSPEGANSLPAVQSADRQARMAKTAFERWDYLTAARSARMAYETLKDEADRIGMTSPSLAASMRQAALGIGPKKDGCRPRYPQE
jgi:hypothetical protein